MEKTYRAVRHKIVRNRQKLNLDDCHHPSEKEQQITTALKGKTGLRILELFSGRGNLTQVYNNFGIVDEYDKTWKRTGDSYRVYHRLISENKKYDVVDLDPYGFPNRFFPDIFLLINDGYLFITMPKPFVNILNGITSAHLTSYYGSQNPSLQNVIERIQLWGICHWREVTLVSTVDLGRLWRLCFRVTKVKATEYTGVRNR